MSFLFSFPLGKKRVSLRFRLSWRRGGESKEAREAGKKWGGPRARTPPAKEENSPLLIVDRCDAFDIVYNHELMYLNPKDADTDNDYISDDRNDDFNGVDRNHAFDNDFDLDMYEPGD